MKCSLQPMRAARCERCAALVEAIQEIVNAASYRFTLVLPIGVADGRKEG